MNPRSFSSQVRRAIEAYIKATGVTPVVEFLGGDQFRLRSPSPGETDAEEGASVQRRLEAAFRGAK